MRMPIKFGGHDEEFVLLQGNVGDVVPFPLTFWVSQRKIYSSIWFIVFGIPNFSFSKNYVL
ncbi:hypothetical protein EUTSA_v10003308mg [Eutrema salsugineum]|uniref:Uncharacterized protein n=1 Tax=Eutrema salsugineum TaxID=72664 RepID=V4NFE3_EUTSA|nr:hypothetical protein EUTSA_v10003308mg [Eutrema salsugineum]